ncbi:MAG: undecaprenyldiphospho-muramoylpentapeptide beta-N-acetylglucosaminyltransferase [Oscillospiraceae bacterium]
MKILLAGGGTAGHINPAIAIATKFKQEGHQILFAGNSNGMEAKLVKIAGFDFTTIKIKGFYRSFSPKDIAHNISAAYLALMSNFRAKKIIKEFSPDIVIGTGGYVSGPIVITAQKMGIKTAIHEQNAYPGVTTKLLAKRANYVFSAVEKAKEHLDIGKNFYVVGNPVRENILKKSKAEAKKELNLDDKMLILSFGGSLGADAINIMAADLMQWHQGKNLINHIHGYGRLGKEKFPKLLQERNITLDNRIKAVEYIDNMDTLLAAADIVICRAGAMTLSELELTQKPCILVPSPNVTANHQFHNAMVLKEKNACYLIEEKYYKKENLISIIENILANPAKLEEMSKNIASLAVKDTADLIYDIIMSKD